MVSQLRRVEPRPTVVDDRVAVKPPEVSSRNSGTEVLAASCTLCRNYLTIRRTGEREAQLQALAVRMVIEGYSLRLSVCKPPRAMGIHARISRNSWKTTFCALLSTARTPVHCVRRSESTRVKACSPLVMHRDRADQRRPLGPCVRPLGKGADGDLVGQTRGRLGIGAAGYSYGIFLGAQQPVDGGSADALAILARVGVQGELAKLFQQRQLIAQDRDQPFAHRQPNRYQTLFSAATTCSSYTRRLRRRPSRRSNTVLPDIRRTTWPSDLPSHGGLVVRGDRSVRLHLSLVWIFDEECERLTSGTSR